MRIASYTSLSPSTDTKWSESEVKSLSHVQLFATPMAWSLPGFSVHGILQARMLEWVTISFSIEYEGEGLFCPDRNGGIRTNQCEVYGRPFWFHCIRPSPLIAWLIWLEVSPWEFTTPFYSKQKYLGLKHQFFAREGGDCHFSYFYGGISIKVKRFSSYFSAVAQMEKLIESYWSNRHITRNFNMYSLFIF